MATVMIVIDIGLGLRSCPTTSRCDSRPMSMATATAMTSASGSGTPAANSVAAVIPPSITHSPCAKLSAPVLLKMMVKPSATSA